MEINGTVHCLFEQSGTFKNEFKKLGYNALDYDIQNNFGQTDFQIDLFGEINKAYDGADSIFAAPKMGGGDLIIAFFPCIYFESLQFTYYYDACVNLRNLEGKQRYDVILERIDNRNEFHKLLYKLYAVCKINGLRLIIENPATPPSYIVDTQNFPKYTFIDRNRMMRGDYFKKPTAYWFINCEPTYNVSLQNDKPQKIIKNCKSGKQAGICSEERSMISSDYARNFICDFIIGKEQTITQKTLFDSNM